MSDEVPAARPPRGEAAVLDALDEALLALVQAAPAGTSAQLLAAAGLAVELALHAAASAGAALAARERVGLACALERCLELLGEGVVDPGVALPALAMAAHTARGDAPAAWAAARYELETLLPVPGQPAGPRRALDVPAASLVRRAPGDPSSSGAAATPGRSASSAERYAAQAEALASAWPEPVRRELAAARRRLRGG